MRNITIILALFLSLFVSCSSDSDGGETIDTIILTTKVPVLSNNGLAISTGGVFSSDFDGSGDYQVGICYSNVAEPTILNEVVYFGQFNGLDFTSTLADLNFGNTYYIKAFARNINNGSVKYGNEVSVFVPISLTTDIVKNISCSGFSVDVTIASGLASNTERGICFSTSQNPTVSNEKITDDTFGVGTFNITLENPEPYYYVHPGTTYYLRSFVRIEGDYHYGNQVSFKTGGYIGGSGGYVFFDKGEKTNNWRYLEAAPDHLIHNDDINWLFTWNNCAPTTFLNGLSNSIGAGAQNTSIIRNGCNYTNNAAAIASATSLNGRSDWFLPSIEELHMLYSLRKENVIPPYTGFYPIISSSQQSNNTNFGVDFTDGDQVTMFKNGGGRVWQVRKF